MNSQKRKIVGFVLVLALLAQSVVPAFASGDFSDKITLGSGKTAEVSYNPALPEDYGDVNGDGTVYYVALGDSVAAGMGTKGCEAVVQPLVERAADFKNMFGGIGMFPLENYKNCAKDSYPYLVAQNLFYALKERGFFSKDTEFDYDVIDKNGNGFGFSNMGLAAYEVNDVVDAIINPAQTAYLFSTIVGDLITGPQLQSYYALDDAVKKTEIADGSRFYNGIYELYNAYAAAGFDAAALNITTASALGQFVEDPDNCIDMGMRASEFKILESKTAALSAAAFDEKIKFAINLFVEPAYGMGNFAEFLVHDMLMAELTKADVVSFNLGSNDLLTQMLAGIVDPNSKIGQQKLKRLKNNNLLEPILEVLIGSLIDGSGSQDDLLGGLTDMLANASLTDILDVLTLLDSDNTRKELEVYAVNAVNGYRRFVEIMRKGTQAGITTIAPVNPKAKIVFVGTINPFGTNLLLPSYDDDQWLTDGAIYCDIPSIISRLYEALEEKVQDQDLLKYITDEIDFSVFENDPRAAAGFEALVKWYTMSVQIGGIVEGWTAAEKQALIGLRDMLDWAEEQQVPLTEITEELIASTKDLVQGDEFKEFIGKVAAEALALKATEIIFGEDAAAAKVEAFKQMVVSDGAVLADSMVEILCQTAQEVLSSADGIRLEVALVNIVEAARLSTDARASYEALILRAETVIADIQSPGSLRPKRDTMTKRLEDDFKSDYNALNNIVTDAVTKEGTNGTEIVQVPEMLLGLGAEFVKTLDKMADEYKSFVLTFNKTRRITFGPGYDGEMLYEELPAYITLDDWIDWAKETYTSLSMGEIMTLITSIMQFRGRISNLNRMGELAAAFDEILESAGKQLIENVTTLKNHFEEKFGDLLGISTTHWAVLMDEITEDPAMFAKVVINLLLNEEVQAEAVQQLLGELTFPLMYEILGLTSSKPVQEMNDRLEDLAGELKVEYVDIYYSLLNEVNLDPHPLTYNHYRISETISEKVAVVPNVKGAKVEIAGGDYAYIGTTDGQIKVVAADATITKNGKTVDSPSFSYEDGDQIVITFHQEQPVYSSAAPKKYTVTLDPNGGNLAEKQFVGSKGAKISAVPTKVGYDFLGWFTAKEGGTKVEKITKTTTLYAHWERSKVSAAEKYIDVNEKDWFCESVEYLTSISAMDGITEDEFKPYDIGTRAQLVEILYNIQGCPSVSGSVPYPDVKEGDEWYDAVLWATQNNVVLGYDNGNFGPEDPITREQLALVLMRYAGSLGVNTSPRADLTDFKDYKSVSKYAADAMRWAVAIKLVRGNKLGELMPGSDASRAEIATILERYAKTILGK